MKGVRESRHWRGTRLCPPCWAGAVSKIVKRKRPRFTRYKCPRCRRLWTLARGGLR